MAVIKNSTLANSMGVIATANSAKVTPYHKGAASSQARSQYSYVASPNGLVVAGRGELGNNASVLGTDRFGNGKTLNLIPLLWDEFEGSTVNTQRWTNTATTFVQAQTALGFSLNSSLLSGASSNSILSSVRRVPKVPGTALTYRCRARISAFGSAVNELGLSDAAPSAATVIANGAFFQTNQNGGLQAIVANQSSYTQVNVTFSTGYTFKPFATYSYEMSVEDSYVTFLVKDGLLGAVIGSATVSVPLTGGKLFGVTHLVPFNRLFTQAINAPAIAPYHVIASVFVGHSGMSPVSKPWQDMLALNSFSSTVVPTTSAQAQTFANSAEPASMTLSNTVAGLTTLGGKFQFAAVAGAVTDYVIFGFQAPIPFSLIVSSVTIDLWNTGAASATTPTTFSWGCYNNNPIVSANSVTGIRRFLGSQTLAVGTPIGANANRIYKKFTAPVVTDPGKFFGIILRMPVGTATAAQVFAGSVDVDGYFE